MTAHPPARATQLRIALALVLLEHKPAGCSISEYVALLRAQVQLRRAEEDRVAGLEGPLDGRDWAAERGGVALPHTVASSAYPITICTFPQPLPAFAPLPAASTPPAPQPACTQAGPSQPAPPPITSPSGVSAAQLLRILVALRDVAGAHDGDEQAAVHAVEGAWSGLERVAVALAGLEEGAADGSGEMEEAEMEGMRTRGRAAKGKVPDERVSREEVERELFSVLVCLLSHALSALPPASLLTAFAPLASLLPLLSTLFPPFTLSVLVPALLATTHDLLAALLAHNPLPAPVSATPGLLLQSDLALLARLSAILSLAHLALAFHPSPLPAGAGADARPLAAATDTLTRLLGAYGADAHLAALALPLPANGGAEANAVSFESAVMGVMERVWAVRDALEAETEGTQR